MSTAPPPRPGTYSSDYRREESYERATGPGALGKSDDEKSSAGFGTVALAHAALALPFIFQPHKAADFLLGSTALPHNVEHEHLFGLLASALIGSSSAAWALKDSADSRDLDSDTSERLQLGLMGMAAAALAALFTHSRDLTNNGVTASGAVAALTFAVPAARMVGTERGRRRLGSRIRGFFDGVGRLFDFSHGFKLSSALYAVLTPVLFVAGAAYLVNPQATLGNVMGYVLKRPDSVHLWRNIGAPMLTVLPAMTYSLKEKADEGRLQESTPRLLNTGLLFASLGHLLVLGPIVNRGDGGKYFPALVGTWATAFLASLVGLSSGNSSISPKRL